MIKWLRSIVEFFRDEPADFLASEEWEIMKREIENLPGVIPVAWRFDPEKHEGCEPPTGVFTYSGELKPSDVAAIRAKWNEVAEKASGIPALIAEANANNAKGG